MATEKDKEFLSFELGKIQQVAALLCRGISRQNSMVLVPRCFSGFLLLS